MAGEESMNKMGIAPIAKLLPVMGMPMVVSMVLQALYNVVDSYFISRMPDTNGIINMGEYGVNALTLAFPIQMLMVSVGVGTGVGINALLSRSLGENNKSKASSIAGNGIFLGVCSYAAFLLVGLLGINAYMGSQTNDAIVLSMGSAYLFICTTMSFGLMLFTIYEKLLQASGRTGLSMIAQVTGALTNIVLDPVMIFGLAGFPAMGIKGAAYATVIGQIVSCILAMVFHYGFNREISHGLRYMKPCRKLTGEIYKIGVPAAVMQALVSIMSYGLNVIYGAVGGAVVTAYGIYYKLQQFVYFATLGMNNALVPVIGFNFGRKDRGRLSASIKWGIGYSLVLMFAGAVCLQVFARPLVGIFSLSDETAAFCLRAIRIVTLVYLVAGVNITCEAIFQAFGDGVKSLLISLTRLVVVLVAAWLLTFVNGAEYYVWWAIPISEVCALGASVFFMNGLIKNTLNQLKESRDIYVKAGYNHQS